MIGIDYPGVQLYTRFIKQDRYSSSIDHSSVKLSGSCAEDNVIEQEQGHYNYRILQLAFLPDTECKHGYKKKSLIWKLKRLQFVDTYIHFVFSFPCKINCLS